MTTPRASDRAAGMAAAMFAVAIWAGWIPVTRLGVVTHLIPADVAALRYGTSGLLLAPVLAMRWREVPWARPWPLLALLIGAGVPYLLLFSYGLRLANSGQGGVLGPGAVGVLTALIGWALIGERPRTRQVVGIAIVATGVLTVVLHDAASGGGRLAGFALIFTAAICWATFTVTSRVLRMTPVVNVAFVSVVNAVFYLPVYAATGGIQRLQAVPAASLALQAGYQGVLTGVVALLAFTFAIDRLGAAGAASFTPLSPVLIAFSGWLIVGDTVDIATALGLLAVAVGVVIANRPSRL
jgi:drug/metabolite transporter (DMT)-like permease